MQYICLFSCNIFYVFVYLDLSVWTTKADPVAFYMVTFVFKVELKALYTYAFMSVCPVKCHHGRGLFMLF